MGNTWQVVDAATRGDQCYEGKVGWYFHQLGDLSEIVTSTITGPYANATDATLACGEKQRGQA